MNRAYLGQDIADMGLSVRSYNCLRRAGCDRVEDVLKLMGDDGQGLRKVRNLGSRSEQEIREKMEELRMAFAAQPEPVVEEPKQRLVKPAKKVWDKQVREYPLSGGSVAELHNCGIETVGDLYKKCLTREPGWYAVRELFDCIAW